MKALILAAGYATRLYPLTENQPKPLLEVGKKAILAHLLDKLKEVKGLKEVFVVTNHRFYDRFRSWLVYYTAPFKIKLIDDGTLSNEDRLGAIGDLNFVLKEEEINEDLMVIAGDNIFGFSLKEFTNFFKNKKKSIVAFRDLKDKEKIKGKLGAGILEGSQVVDFEEKPLEPRSTLAATACYIFSQEDLSLVEKALEQGKADRPGDLVKFLLKSSEVHGFVTEEHWFDIGSFESLQEAENFYKNVGAHN